MHPPHTHTQIHLAVRVRLTLSPLAVSSIITGHGGAAASVPHIIILTLDPVHLQTTSCTLTKRKQCIAFGIQSYKFRQTLECIVPTSLRSLISCWLRINFALKIYTESLFRNGRLVVLTWQEPPEGISHVVISVHTPSQPVAFLPSHS